MISIKQLLERYERSSTNQQRLEGVSRLRGLLVEGLQARHESNWGITQDFTLSARDLLNRLEEDLSAAELLDLACETLDLFETHSKQATTFFHEQSRQMQSMVAMLTETIADISAQSDTSIATLQSIERQIEHASSLDDIRGLKTSLASCLAAVREASVQQKTAMQTTVNRLHEQVKKSRPSDPQREPSRRAGSWASTEEIQAEYAIVFKLQRADHIRSRFGDGAIDQMLALVEAGLKPAQHPADRLMRWKRDSFLMFVSSPESVLTIRQRFGRVVTGIGQGHVEVGKNSALLAVGVDWAIFPQAQYPSLERLFLDVDSFLSQKPWEAF